MLHKIIQWIKDNKWFCIWSSVFFAATATYLIVGVVVIGRYNMFALDYLAHVKNLMTGDKRFMYTLINNFTYLLSLMSLSYNALLVIYLLIVSIAKLATVIIVYCYLSKRLELKKSLLIPITFALMFVSMILNPSIYGYVGISSPNLWHNPTLICMTPFALLALIILERLLIKNEVTIKNLVLLTVYLTLATLIKPSLIFVLIPTLGLIFLYQLIKNKGKGFLNILKICACFVPSVIWMFVQYALLFTENNGGFAFTFGGWFNWAWHPLLFFCAFLFPLVVYLFNHNSLTKIDLFTILLTFIAFLQAALITETPADAGNFSWGYCFALFVLFIMSTKNFIQNYKNTSLPKRITGISVFALHLASGIVFLLVMFCIYTPEAFMGIGF